MNPTLQQLQLAFGEGLRGLTALETQLRTNDDSVRWSVQQIVEHLLMTYELSAGTFDKRLAVGRPTEARPNVQQRLGQIIVLKLRRFPQGRLAPAMVMPGASVDPRTGEELSDRTRMLLERFDEAAVKAEELFGSGRVITHPILGPMSVEGWRQFHLIHGKHHLKQIAAIRSTHGC